MSRRCTKTTWPIPAACPTTGATTSTPCSTCPPPTAATPRTCRTCRSSMPSPSAPSRARTRVVVASGADSELGRKRTAVQQLIAAYRNVGARWADLDPLKRTERENIPELEPSFYGFTDADQETVFNTSNTFFGKDTMSLRDLLNALRETYCGTIGAEYMYITDQDQKRWWQQKLESDPQQAAVQRRAEEAHPRPPDGGRRPGALPAHQVRRPEALLARRRRELHRLDGRADPAGRRARACRKS